MNFKNPICFRQGFVDELGLAYPKLEGSIFHGFQESYIFPSGVRGLTWFGFSKKWERHFLINFIKPIFSGCGSLISCLWRMRHFLMNVLRQACRRIRGKRRWSLGGLSGSCAPRRIRGAPTGTGLPFDSWNLPVAVSQPTPPSRTCTR